VCNEWNSDRDISALVDPDVPMRQRFSLDHLDDINSGTEEEREIGVPPAQRQLSDPPSDHELSALEKDENVNDGHAHAHPIKPNTFTFNQGTSALNAVNENEGDFEADALDTLPQMTPGNSNKLHSGTPKEVTPFDAQEASVSPFASPRRLEQVVSDECAVSPQEEKEENDAVRGSPDSETFVRNSDDRDFSETMLSPNVDESPVNVKGSSTKMSYDQSSGSTRI